MVLFLRCQGRSGLVEDNDLRFEPDRPGDLDHLPLGGAERQDRRRRIDREIERLKKLLRFDIDAAQAVEEFLVAQIEVLRDGHRGHETGLLIDHRDAVSPSQSRAGDMDLLAVETDFAPGRHDRPREDLDQRRFAGAVLSQDRVNLAATQVEVDVLQRGDAAIGLSDASHLEERRLGLRRDAHDIKPL